MTLTAAPPRCDALSEGRAATDWGMFALPCQSRRGLRTFVDAAGTVRYFCASPGHKRNVIRRFGIWPNRCHFCDRDLSDVPYTAWDFGAAGVHNVCGLCEEKGDES